MWYTTGVMGLDQYAKKVKSDYDYETKTDTIVKTEIHYWRKHNALEGWMANLWRSRGMDGEFNCQVVQLTKDNLDNLENDIKEGRLPQPEGFFFVLTQGRMRIAKQMTLSSLRKQGKLLTRVTRFNILLGGNEYLSHSNRR